MSIHRRPDCFPNLQSSTQKCLENRQSCGFHDKSRKLKGLVAAPTGPRIENDCLGCENMSLEDEVLLIIPHVNRKMPVCIGCIVTSRWVTAACWFFFLCNPVRITTAFNSRRAASARRMASVASISNPSCRRSFGSRPRSPTSGLRFPGNPESQNFRS